MGIDALLAGLEAEAAGEIARRREEGRRVAAGIREASAVERERLRGEHLARVEEEETRRGDRERAALRRRVRAGALEARARVLERVLDHARRRLPGALETPAARRRLATDARAALRFLPPGPVVVECPPALAREAEAALAAAAHVRIEIGEAAPPGFRLRDAAGRVVVDDTLPARLERSRPELMVELVREVGS